MEGIDAVLKPLSAYEGLLGAILLIMAMPIRPTILHAQETTSARLENQAAKLQQTVQNYKKSITLIADQASPALLSRMETELLSHETALVSLEKVIKQVKAGEEYISVLKHLKQQFRGRASNSSLITLDNQIAAEQVKLAKMVRAAVVPTSASSNAMSNRTTPFGQRSDPAPPPGPMAARNARTEIKPAVAIGTHDPSSAAPSTANSPHSGSAPPAGTHPQAILKAPKPAVQAQVTPGGSKANKDKAAQSPTKPSAEADKIQPPPQVGSDIIRGTGNPGDEIQVIIDGNEKKPYPTKPATVGDDKKFAVVLPQRLTVYDTVVLQSRKKTLGPWTKSKPNSTAPVKVSAYLTRLLLGTDFTTASSSNSKQNFFADAFLAVDPVAGTGDPEHRKFWIWGDARIMSIPSPTATLSVSQIADQSFVQPTLKNVARLTSAAQFAIGIQRKLPFLHTCGLPSTTWNFIAAFGATTPFSSQQTISIFNNNRTIQERYPQVPTDTTAFPYVAFESPERDRFYRQYYGGLRFMTFFKPAQSSVQDPFPGLLDVTFGQDEAATKGGLRGGLLRVDASYPMQSIGEPWLYVFGSVEMKLTRHKLFDPLVLNSTAPPGTQPTASNVFPLMVPPPDRDLFRIGIGIDLNRLLPNKKSNNSSSSTSSAK